MSKRSARTSVNREFGVWNLLIPAGRALWLVVRVLGAGCLSAFQLIGVIGTLIFSFGERRSTATDTDRVEQPPPAARAAVAVGESPSVQEAIEASSDEAEIFGPRQNLGSLANGEKSSMRQAGPMRKSGVAGATLAVADRHLIKRIGSQTIHFSMYLKEGKVTRYLVKAGAKHELDPFLLESAEHSGVPFTLSEAVRHTERELSAARSRSASTTKKRTERASSVRSRDRAMTKTEPMTDAPPDLGEAPPWMDTPAFEELPPSQAVPVAEDGVGESVIQTPSPVKMIERERPVDWRGGVRFVGEVISAGIVQCHPVDKKPYKIFSMTLRSSDGETKEFRGVELNELVTKHFIRRGDIVSLKRGRQEFEVTEDGQTKSRTRNVYDFRLIKRGPEPGIANR